MAMVVRFIIATIFLCGCDIPRNKYSLPIVNGYYEKPVYHDISTGYFHNNNKKMVVLKSFGFPFWNGVAPTGVSPNDLGEGGFNVQYVEQIYFYQDETRQCFLFSYDNETLRNLKSATGQELSSSNVIFIIKEDGLVAVSKEEYESIKPTLKPHPYDPSLCKPKPADANDTK